MSWNFLSNTHTSYLFPQQVTVQDQNTESPVLPLVDSNAQHLIQKRITVEKLTSWYVWVWFHLCVFINMCGQSFNEAAEPWQCHAVYILFFQHHTDIFKFTCSVFITCVETLLAPLDSTNILTVIITFFPCICLFVRHCFVSMPCSLKNIVGPLRLTMTDVSADLNNLVRTFRSVQHKHTLLCGSACIRSHSLILLVIAYSDFIHNNYWDVYIYREWIFLDLFIFWCRDRERN